jgi:P pilus assembly chaperone PapD
MTKENNTTGSLFGGKIMISCILIFSCLLTCSADLLAQGNLIIVPRRVVFEGTKRTQDLNLANTGTDTAKYLISTIQYKMLEDGNFQEITKPDTGQNFADKNFRFFPRSVVLAPNEAQTIKIQLINTGNLQSGEYRSHLYFRAVPNEKPLVDKESEKSESAISVRLIPTFGIAIPVIIRRGTSTSNVSFSASSIVISSQGNNQLKVAFTRSGNMSVYGDIKVDYISPQGKTTQVGMARGFAIYTPNTTRHFILDLDNNTNVDYHKGKLHIVYTTSPEEKSIKVAETELILL